MGATTACSTRFFTPNPPAKSIRLPRVGPRRSLPTLPPQKRAPSHRLHRHRHGVTLGVSGRPSLDRDDTAPQVRRRCQADKPPWPWQATAQESRRKCDAMLLHMTTYSGGGFPLPPLFLSPPAPPPPASQLLLPSYNYKQFTVAALPAPDARVPRSHRISPPSIPPTPSRNGTS